jgi:hypothetical protein
VGGLSRSFDTFEYNQVAAATHSGFSRPSTSSMPYKSWVPVNGFVM